MDFIIYPRNRPVTLTSLGRLQPGDNRLLFLGSSLATLHFQPCSTFQTFFSFKFVTMEDYRYKSLPGPDYIRLLHILNHEDRERTGSRFCLEIVALSSEPRYIAISYCWGEKMGRIPIECGGAIVRVTPNLKSFFNEIDPDFHDDELNLFWVDAICINQRDITERNSQVGMMRDIYHSAVSVMVWLGPANSESDMGVDMVQALLQAKKHQDELGDTPGLLIAMSQEYRKRIGLPSWTSEVYEFYASLFQRPWFQRIWIVQEVAVSRHCFLLYGSKSCDWSDFNDALDYANVLGITLPQRNVTGINQFRETIHSAAPRDMLGLLLRFRSFHSSDPRDKVFALCGLTRPLDFEPDYNLTTQEVFTKLAVSFLENETTLDILSVPKPSETNRLKGLPSWVPDWTQCDSTHSFTGRDWNFVGVRKAGGDDPRVAKFSTNLYILTVEGYVIDSIVDLGSPYAVHIIDTDSWWVWTLILNAFSDNKIMLEWEALAFTGQKIYMPTGEDLLDAYWKTISAGGQVGYDVTVDTSLAGFLRWDDFHRPYSQLRRITRYFFNRSIVFNIILFFVSFCYREVIRSLLGRNPDISFQQVSQMSAQRRFMKTRNGYIGLAPQCAQVGDSIGLFTGGRFPLVIRPSDSDWELVGDSYVHGMMDGSYFEAEKCEMLSFV